jgi:putative ABC transport system ATP-binding protein
MISVSDLEYSYDSTQVLRFPDFQIQKGNHALLLGESGCGKTTLLHILGGLLRNYRGNIAVNNTDLSTLNENKLDSFRGRNIGFIFQRNHLIAALTVENNLRLAPYLAGLEQDSQRILEVLDELSLAEKVKSKISELSQGQAQRVAIARAILNHPPIILADEPTSALDDKNCEKVITMLVNIAAHNGATLVVATHDQRLKDVIRTQVILN